MSVSPEPLDVAAFVDVVQESIGPPAGSWLHYGLTSSDVVDTALSTVLVQAVDLVIAEGRDPANEHPFKGNIDIDKLKAQIEETGRENVPYVRMEAGTNLIGGQPFSIASRNRCSEPTPGLPPHEKVSLRAQPMPIIWS